MQLGAIGITASPGLGDAANPRAAGSFAKRAVLSEGHSVEKAGKHYVWVILQAQIKASFGVSEKQFTLTLFPGDDQNLKVF